MDREKAWIWFKGGLQGGHWVGGFWATKSDEGGYIVEKSDFVKCRLPEWRVSLSEPENPTQPPSDISSKSIWKHI